MSQLICQSFTFMKLSSVEKHRGVVVGTGAQGQEGCGFYSGMMILCGFCMCSLCLWVLSGYSSCLTQSKYSTCQLATLHVNVSMTSSTCFSLVCFYVVDGLLTLAPNSVVIYFIF